MSDRVDRGLGRAVQIGDALDLETTRNFPTQIDRDRLAAESQMIQLQIIRRFTKDRLKVRRRAADEGHAVADHP